MENTTLQLLAGLGMIAVGVIAIAFWRHRTRLAYRWFWMGAALWTVAVGMKIPFSVYIGSPAMASLTERLPSTLRMLVDGLYAGVQSAFFEMGLTILAGVIWRRLGSDAQRAIGVGLGAGAFEAIALGLMTVVGILVFMAGVPGSESVGTAIDAQAEKTALFWLLPPVERLLTLMVHGASRALILLGIAKRQWTLVLCGFGVFAGLDGASVFGRLWLGGQGSMWWLEGVPLVFAGISLPILVRCQSTNYRQDAKAAKACSNGTDD